MAFSTGAKGRPIWSRRTGGDGGGGGGSDMVA